MRKKTAKKLRKLAQMITTNSPDTMKKVYKRLKKTWNEKAAK